MPTLRKRIDLFDKFDKFGTISQMRLFCLPYVRLQWESKVAKFRFFFFFFLLQENITFPLFVCLFVVFFFYHFCVFNTVEALLTDPLVSDQLYLRPP